MGIENNGNIYLPFNAIAELPQRQVDEEVQYAEVHFDSKNLVLCDPLRSIVFLEYGQVFFVNSGWDGLECGRKSDEKECSAVGQVTRSQRGRNRTDNGTPSSRSFHSECWFGSSSSSSSFATDSAEVDDEYSSVSGPPTNKEKDTQAPKCVFFRKTVVKQCRFFSFYLVGVVCRRRRRR